MMTKLPLRLNAFTKVLLGNSNSGLMASLQSLLTNILILIINIATGILTARLLGPHDRGVQAAVSLWPGILINLAAIGLPAAALYHSKLSPNLGKYLLSTAFVLGVIAGGLGSIVGIFMAPVWLANYDQNVIHVAQLFMLVIPVAVLTNIFAAVTQASQDFRTFNGFRLSQPLITLTLLVLLSVTHRLTAFSAAFAYLCPSILAFIWLWGQLHAKYPFSLARFRNLYKRLLSYGLRYYSGDILGIFSGQLDKIVIVSMLNPASMGLYTVAYSLSGMLGVFNAAVNSVILPRMIDLPLPEIWKLLGRSARVSTLISLCAAGVLVVTGPLLINLFYGEEYQGATLVFFILAADAVVGGLAFMLAQVFYAVGKPELMMFRQLASLTIMVPGMFLLGSRFGIVGIASVSLLESVTMVILTLSAFPSILKLPLPRLWAPREDLAYALQIWREWNKGGGIR